MLLRYGLPILAIAGASFAAYTVARASRPVEPPRPLAEPASSPFSATVAGAGLVEASTENIAIGSHEGGVVSVVHVKAGDRVRAGAPLFSIDDRSLKAQLAVQSAALLSAEAELLQLRSAPRAEEIPPLEAEVEQWKAALDDARRLDELARSVNMPGAISDEELSRRGFAVQTSRARLAEAEARLALLKAGTWAPQIAIAQASVAAAQARVDQVRTELERLTVCAPVDAEILKVDVRPGEFATAGAMERPLITLGGTDLLHIRVDVDENDAWRVRSGAKAVGHVRGNPQLKADLEFVRFEPYVIPKRSLTGASTERVDTRVLQVIFAFERSALPVFVGQQMDVSIEAEPIAPAVTSRTEPTGGKL